MPYLKRINSLPLINHISYKYAQVSDIGPSWSSCFVKFILSSANAFNLDLCTVLLFGKELKAWYRASYHIIRHLQGYRSSIPICPDHNFFMHGFRNNFAQLTLYQKTILGLLQIQSICR